MLGVVVEVGVRELRENLSRWLSAVRDGEEVIVTSRGRPIARLTGVSSDRSLDRLVREGVVQLPRKRKARIRESDLIKPRGNVSDFVSEQRR